MKIRKLAAAVALTFAAAPSAYASLYFYSNIPLIGTVALCMIRAFAP